MKYTVVKQLLNNSIDNFNNFIFKIVDFGKILNMAFWAFLDIWYTLISAFVFLFLYLYYIILFILDKLLGVQSSLTFWQKFRTPGTLSMRRGYGDVATSIAAAKAAASPAPGITASFSRAPVGAKISLSKKILDFISNIYNSASDVIKKGIMSLSNIGIKRVKPPEDDDKKSKGKGLIEEYLKEYEKKRKL